MDRQREATFFILRNDIQFFNNIIYTSVTIFIYNHNFYENAMEQILQSTFAETILSQIKTPIKYRRKYIEKFHENGLQISENIH